jgi:vancomycin resistance protein YoaR
MNFFSEDFDLDEVIELDGDVVEATGNESYKSIDTMVSSFVTTFDASITARATNLRTALNFINGAIIEPDDIFSYYKYAGPYDRSGYVFYYEFVGNGVCQIATTVYDAALLGGLEIVKRYPHAKKSVYVDGGLDATVASYSSGWYVDFQFKNTYKYPIYIKAYAVGGEAHVEFWSNSNAKEGKTYTTESVKLGNRHYKTYLHTFKDGAEIDKSFIAETWYTEE